MKIKKVFEQVKGKVNNRVKMLTIIKLNDVNLVRAIHTKEIQVTVYPKKHL